MQLPIYKRFLSNGLTVLVVPRRQTPKVSTQLFYNVGSKDEKTGEKGLAHLIEHMIFKGTDKLSESDINLITHKLSGYCNAFTSYDYTGYLFDFPRHQWHESLPIMADCMRNCTFKEQFLRSEMKAVIQELKMYKDRYANALVESMISAIFDAHPYHHPIIGYKQDLWSVTREHLVNFYQHHYVPNNATLVGVGDLDVEEFFDRAEQAFGHIPADPTYTKEAFYWSPELEAKHITLYRDIQQPFYILAWSMPGAREQQQYKADLASWVLASGKGSRLYKKLVNERGLVTDVDSFSEDLFDYGLFFVYFTPTRAQDAELIIALIKEELAQLAAQGPTEAELNRALRKAQTAHLHKFEKNQDLAYAIGKSYLATGNERYELDYLEQQVAQSDVQEFFYRYIRPAVTHTGSVVPIAESEKVFWQERQRTSDAEDARILGNVTREADVEEGVHVHAVAKQQAQAYISPQAHKVVLPNGLTLLYHHNPDMPKIDVVVSLKTKSYYDPVDQQGIGLFLSHMLLEGTQNYSADELADVIESLGMSIESGPGMVHANLLAHDLPRALALLQEILTRPHFTQSSIDRVRERMLADLKEFWDDASSFIGHLARKAVYQNHPYSKLSLGEMHSIEQMNEHQLQSYFDAIVTPSEAYVAIVGDLTGLHVERLVAETLGQWVGPVAPSLVYPPLAPTQAYDVNYTLNRDQVVLAFAGLSVTRDDPRYINLLLFDQILTGGVLRSMSSRLFDLRERSGLFYTIGGSLVNNVSDQPGMMFIKTIVSNDRLNEAEIMIADTLNHAADVITAEEFENAQDALIFSIADNFATNASMANAFIWLERMGLAANYFDTFAQSVKHMTVGEVSRVVKSMVHTNNMVKIRVGRV